MGIEDGANDKAAVMEYTGESWQMVGGAPASSGMAAMTPSSSTTARPTCYAMISRADSR